MLRRDRGATGIGPVLLSPLLTVVSFLPASAQATQSICDRTAAVRDEILSESEASDCAAVTSSQLASVSRLRLANSSITSLKSGDFAGLSGLTRLELYGNELDSLPSGVFSGLDSLTVLLMSHNSLDALPSDALAGLTSLRELSVSHNKLTALPSDLLSDLSSLQFLYLDGNDIAALPAGIFAGVPLLSALFLYGNDFTTFPASTFTGLASLSWLTLEGGALTSLPAGAFSGLAELRHLDLSNNSLGSIPGDAFSGATAIGRLLLNGNSLSSLPDGVFTGLSALDRALWLHDNSSDPMPIKVSLVATSDTTVKAKARTGAPFAIRVPLRVTNGTLGASTVTIPAGAIESSAIAVTRSARAQGPVTVDVGPLPGLPDLGTYTHYWGDENSAHHGYELKRSTDLPLALNKVDTTVASLVLTPSTISENGGSTTITATASPASGTAFSVTVGAAEVSPAISSDFTLSGSTLRFAAGDSMSTGTVTITANDNDVDAADKSVTVSGSIATSGADAKAPADMTLTITDDDDAAPLTASFSDVPASHDGSSAFTFTLSFSEDIGGLGYRTLRDSAFDVTGGAVTGVRRQTQGSNQDWSIKVRPDSRVDVVIALPEMTDCSAAGAICTPDDRKLSQAVSATVAGPAVTPALGVADASAAEGSAVAFTVSLSEASSDQVTVEYATSGGTATSGTDFTAASGTLTFAANETSKTVSVATTDDTVDEANEIFTLTLSSPTNATLRDSTATGTIIDDDGSVPLTAEFRNVPAEHDGSTVFTLRVSFSEDLASGGSGRKLARALTLTGATRGEVRRVNARRDLYEFPVRPSGTNTVTVSLSATSDCTANDAVCTGDGKALSNEPKATVVYAASSSSIAGDAAAGPAEDDGVEAALALAAGLTPDDATAALFGERSLTDAQKAALDRLGNRNGSFDLGDVLSWIERCRRGEVDCGGPSAI